MTLSNDLSDPRTLRNVFAAFPSGVSVMSFESEGQLHGLVASSFMVGVSLEPPLVAVAVQKDSETWPLMRDAGAFGVSIFGTGQGHLVRQLANKDRSRRFADVAVSREEHGSVFLQGAAVWLDCTLYSEFEAGDHFMGLLEVKQVALDHSTDPLIWHGSRFRDLQIDFEI